MVALDVPACGIIIERVARVGDNSTPAYARALHHQLHDLVFFQKLFWHRHLQGLSTSAGTRIPGRACGLGWMCLFGKPLEEVRILQLQDLEHRRHKTALLFEDWDAGVGTQRCSAHSLDLLEQIQLPAVKVCNVPGSLRCASETRPRLNLSLRMLGNSCCKCDPVIAPATRQLALL